MCSVSAHSNENKILAKLEMLLDPMSRRRSATNFQRGAKRKTRSEAAEPKKIGCKKHPPMFLGGKEKADAADFVVET